MKDIRFRAWDKIGKRMGEVNYIKYSNVQYNQVSARFKQNEKTVDEGFNYGDKDGCDNIILMQYTGLKDKNGVEIYEGDIVTVFDAGEVFTGIVAYDLEECDFKATNGEEDYGNNFSYIGSVIEEIEVIGNIYENPELLKEGE